MENRKSITVEDLVLNDEFSDFILNKSENYQYWEKYINEHPEYSMEFEKAKKIILFLNKNTKEPVNVNKTEELQKLLNRIDKKQRVITLSKRMQKYAAIFILIITSFFFLSLIENVKYKSYETANTNQSIILNDNSEVVLNKNSQVKIHRLYGILNRKVKLEGDAFFKVTPNKKQEFKVACNDCNITVLGTKFDVKTYDTNTQVSVKQGKVLFQANHAFDDEIILTKQMAAAYIAAKGIEEVKYKINDFAWHTGEFEFNNSSLLDITKSLQSYYPVTFVVPAKYHSDSLNLYVSQMDIEQVLNLIQTLLPDLNYTKSNNQIILK